MYILISMPLTLDFGEMQFENISWERRREYEKEGKGKFNMEELWVKIRRVCRFLKLKVCRIYFNSLLLDVVRTSWVIMQVSVCMCVLLVELRRYSHHGVNGVNWNHVKEIMSYFFILHA